MIKSLTRLTSLVFAATLACLLYANAQQQSSPVVGFLTSGSLASLNKKWVAAFHRGLAEAGYTDGQNIQLEFRAADDHYDRLPSLAGELVRMPVSVIVAAGGPVSALGAKKATDTIPIVFTTIADPVKSGLVESLNRPGGNATGTAGLTSELDAKRLELLHQIKPSARLFGVLVNPNRPGVDANSKELQDAAKMIGCEVVFQNAGPDNPIEVAFAKLAEQRVDALVVTADPFFNFRRSQVVALAARYKLPGIYQWREFVEDGGLMSYGPSIADAYYQAGLYAGRIVKGAKPADLPVIQPTTFELVINQKAARSLGIETPSQLLVRATEVIECCEGHY
jgi:putative tryptophan/tyrosine transport system substrate-binding protein